MKNLLTIAAGVLVSTLAFADGSQKTSTASVGIMNSGSDLVKLFYKGEKAGRVTVSIMNKENEIVFSEKMHGESFMRPYNFKNLPAGTYTMSIEDCSGKRTETIEYGLTQHEKKLDILKIDGRYLVSGYSQSSDVINVRIADAEGKVIYQEGSKVDGQFARLFNLKAVKGEFSILVSNEQGDSKEYHN